MLSASIGVSLLWILDLIADDEYSYSWMTWWIGDSIGVLLIVPLVFIFLGKPAEVWSMRRIRVAVPMVVTLFAIINIFVIASQQAQSQIESDFRARAMILDDNLGRIIEKNIEVLYSIQGLFSRPGSVSHDEFQRYVKRALERNTGIQALSWNPVISQQQRAKFEQTMRDRGLSGPGITERDPSGKLASAAIRDKYVAVSYISPQEGNQKALGFDVYSNPSRRQALDQACLSGELVATNPIRLVQESGHQNGVLFFLPVYENGLMPELSEQRCTRLAGYVVGVFRTGDLLQEAIEVIDSVGIGVSLVDQSNEEEPLHLAYYLSGKPGNELVLDIEDAPVIPGNLLWQTDLSIGQRTWQLNVAASNNYIAIHRSWAAWGVLTGGLVFTASLGIFLMILTGRVILDRRRANELSVEITQRELTEKDLHYANQKLEKLATIDPLTEIYNRRYIQNLGEQLDGETQRYKSEYTVMILDVDFFKRVNDRWGHQVGDEVLQEITKNIGNQLRDTDCFGRWGGEEFIVVGKYTNLDDSVLLAKRLCDSVREHATQPAGQVTISIGVSNNMGEVLFEEVVSMADKALYSAKENGRDRVEFQLPDAIKSHIIS